MRWSAHKAHEQAGATARAGLELTGCHVVAFCFVFSVAEYINTYERAVFGDHKCSYEEYTHFMKIVMQIVGTINEKTHGGSTGGGGAAASVAGEGNNAAFAHSYANVSLHARTLADRQRL